MDRRHFLVAAGLSSILQRAKGGSPLMLTIPLAREPNSQFKVNRFEPEFLLKPRVLLNLRNPGSGQSGQIRGFVDTGADACHIGVALAQAIGLQATNDPGAKVWGASGPFEVRATLVDVDVIGEDGKAFTPFGRRQVAFYLQPTLKDVILGVRGFLDQFAEVRFNYRAAVLTLVA